MEPKKHKKKQIKESQQSPKRLKAKRELTQEDQTTQTEYLQYLAKYFEQQSQKNKVQPHHQKTKTQSQTQSHEDNQTECGICMQKDMSEGKYILSCRHSLCNECFKYWSNIDTQCPLCYKTCKSVRMIFNSVSRETHIEPRYKCKPCQFCSSSNNHEQMYYCDNCEINCTHIYCRPELLSHTDRTFWLCYLCMQAPNSRNYNRSYTASGKNIVFQQEITQLNSYLSDSQSEALASERMEAGREEHQKRKKASRKEKAKDRN